MAYQQQSSPESEEISKYNDAGYSVIRSHNLLEKCYISIMTGNLSRWKILLDSMWLELIPSVLRKKKKSWLKRNKELKELIAKAGNNKNKLYFALMKRHEFIVAVKDKVGKGGVYVDENADLEG